MSIVTLQLPFCSAAFKHTLKTKVTVRYNTKCLVIQFSLQ